MSCIVASASSARPISCVVPDGAMMRLAFSGSAPNSVMFVVSRRIGRSTTMWRTTTASAETSADIVSEIVRTRAATTCSAAFDRPFVHRHFDGLAAHRRGAKNGDDAIVGGEIGSPCRSQSLQKDGCRRS